MSGKRILVDGIYLGMEMKGVGRYTANTLRQLAALDTVNEYMVLVRAGAALPSLPQGARFAYIPIHLHDHYRHGWWTLGQAARHLDADLAWIPYETPLGKLSCPYYVVCHDALHLIQASQRAGGAHVSFGRTQLLRLDARFMHARSMARALFLPIVISSTRGWKRIYNCLAHRCGMRHAAPGADFAGLSRNLRSHGGAARLDQPEWVHSGVRHG